MNTIAMIYDEPKLFFEELPQNSRVLGLDLGDKTIGVALSDITLKIATPYTTIKRKKFSKDAEVLKNIIDEYGVAGLVIGFPYNIDGSEGRRCQSTRQFARNLLKLFDIPIVFHDERFSTIAVTEVLWEAGMSAKKHKAVVDKMAASYILQGAFDIINKD